jgi:hypothetical protein
MVEICAGLPGVELEEGQHVGFSVRGKRFAWLQEDHHGDGRLSFVCKAPPGENAALAERDPGRYFIPSYVGPRGWVGLWLDAGSVDWDEAERLALDAYRMTAPRRMVERL